MIPAYIINKTTNKVPSKTSVAAHVKVEGVSVHPGEGKNALINALLLLNELINSFPAKETPYDAGYDDGYWHINSINGTSDVCEMDMILRDFDYDNLLKRCDLVRSEAQRINAKYPKAKIEVEIKEQYYNMLPYVLKDPRPVEVTLLLLKEDLVSSFRRNRKEINNA